MVSTAGPCSDTLSSSSLRVYVCVSPYRLMDLSAASDVERTHVTRDQDGVSAMRAIVVRSINVKCKFVTCLPLWSQLPKM